jgi:exodeoxyribonuclease VII small subunit
MSKDTTLDPAAIAALPFEEAMRQLEAIVAELERGDVSLEASIALYEKGEALKKRCETLLAEAQMRIEKITLGSDGKPTGKVPLDN